MVSLEFRKALIKLINKHEIDQKLDTPDFVLSDYMIDCLKCGADLIQKRDACK